MRKKYYLCTLICAYMKLLLVLLAVMTWTVESKNAVSLSDDSTVPYDIEVGYGCTYQKGDVRANDTATLVLSHLEGITINGIEVYVKSNKSGGAGTFTVTANGQTIGTKTGTFADWFGAYDNTEYHALSFINRPLNDVHTLTISLVGIANSLHIEKYVITYAPRPAYTVTLMRGSSVYGTQTESQSGAGVMLPKLLDVDDWHHVAWTAEPFQTMNTMSSSWIEPGMWHPTSDCTLWAVYEYQPPVSESIVTDLADGVYVYAEWSYKKAMSGGIVGGIAGSADVNINDPNQWYAVTFLTDSTATIQLMYTYEFIGFSGTQLSSEQSVWKVYHNGPLTAFYTEVNGKNYILWPNYLKDMGHGDYAECAALMATNDLSKTSTVLLSTESAMEEPLYSCFPEAQGVEEVTSEGVNELTNEWVIPFGNYEILIKNGQKYLRIRE